MASGIQSVGLTALMTFQRALQVTAHNIANAGTDGYSRQSVNLASLTGGVTGAGPIGGGVEMTHIQRNFDNLLFSQLTGHQSALGSTRVMSELALTLDSLLGSNGLDLTRPLSAFSGALEELASDPTSIPARTGVLAEAGALSDRYQLMSQRLQDIRGETNSRMQAYTAEINSLSDGIAELNQRIAEESVNGMPNDLMDQRDQAISELSELVDIKVVNIDGNIKNVFIGKGQNLVLGSLATHLIATPSEYDGRELEIAIDSSAGPLPIQDSITGGKLGGAVSFLRDVLAPTQNAIGRQAMTFAQLFNDQQIRGIDLNGNLGAALFRVATPQTLPSSGNSNLLTDTTSVSIDDYSALTTEDYQLDFDGSVWSLTSLTTGANVPLLPSGADFLADGLRISVDPTAAAGDSYRLRPTRTGAKDTTVAVTDPRQIAAAAALSVTPASTNTGSAQVSSVAVLDPADPTLLTPSSIVFDSATSFRINGGPSQAYTPGADILANGWQLQISGSPAIGDSFSVSPNNQGEVGNGANALLLGNIDKTLVLDGQTLSIAGAQAQLVSVVGVQTRSLGAVAEIQSRLVDDINGRMQQVQGVNLDEEAIKLQQLQQAYLAAAEIFVVADEMFQSLLGAVRR